MLEGQGGLYLQCPQRARQHGCCTEFTGWEKPGRSLGCRTAVVSESPGVQDKAFTLGSSGEICNQEATKSAFFFFFRKKTQPHSA